jgi:hypothetical protein
MKPCSNQQLESPKFGHINGDRFSREKVEVFKDA